MLPFPSSRMMLSFGEAMGDPDFLPYTYPFFLNSPWWICNALGKMGNNKIASKETPYFMNNLQSIASLEQKLAVCWSVVGKGQFYSGLALEKPLNFRFFGCEGEKLPFPCPPFLWYVSIWKENRCASLWGWCKWKPLLYAWQNYLLWVIQKTSFLY